MLILLKMILKLLFMSDLWLVKIKFKQLKAFKKEIGKELMPVAWHQQIHF